jgi:hypothetical protein
MMDIPPEAPGLGRGPALRQLDDWQVTRGRANGTEVKMLGLTAPGALQIAAKHICQAFRKKFDLGR